MGGDGEETYLCNSQLESQILNGLRCGIRDAGGDYQLGVVGPGYGEDGFDGAVGYCEVLGRVGEGGAEGPFVVVSGIAGSWWSGGRDATAQEVEVGG